MSGVIVQNLGPLSFPTKVIDGQVWRRHLDHLKEVSRDVFSGGSAQGA